MIKELLSVIPKFGDDETGRIFRRIYGGMRWPGASSGAIVVIGEDFEKTAALDEHALWVLHEYENRNASEIIGRCEELKGLLKVEKFYGDTANRLMMKEMRNRNANFSLSKAPFVDEPDVYQSFLSIIREKTSAVKKVLNFGGKSTLPALLNSLNSSPSNNSLESDFPQIIALGYALSAFVAFECKKPLPPVATFDALDPGVGY